MTCKHHNESQFNERYRLQYSQTEVTQKRDNIENNIIRTTLEYLKIDSPLHISISSDLPTGSGLGSSSSFTVALLYGLKTLFQIPTNQFEIAEDAFKVESLINGNSIGRQDQYAAAIGGYNYYNFDQEGIVNVKPIQNSADALDEITKKSFLLWTGISRSSTKILDEQNKQIENNLDDYRKMNELTERFYRVSTEKRFTCKDYAEFINENWKIKRKMSASISTKSIQKLMDKCKDHGALGYKLLGAGGGGYVLVIGNRKDEIMRNLERDGHYVENIHYDPMGSRFYQHFNHEKNNNNWSKWIYWQKSSKFNGTVRKAGKNKNIQMRY